MDDDGTTWTTVQGKNKGKAKTNPKPVQSTIPPINKDKQQTSKGRCPPTNESHSSQPQTSEQPFKLPHNPPHKYSSNNTNNNYQNQNKSNKFRKRYNYNDNPRIDNTTRNNNEWPGNSWKGSISCGGSERGGERRGGYYKHNHYNKQDEAKRSQDEINANTLKSNSTYSNYSNRNYYTNKQNKDEKLEIVKCANALTNNTLVEGAAKAIDDDHAIPSTSTKLESNDTNSNVSSQSSSLILKVPLEISITNNDDVIDTCSSSKTPTLDLQTDIDSSNSSNKVDNVDNDNVKSDEKTENSAVQLKSDLVRNDSTPDDDYTPAFAALASVSSITPEINSIVEADTAEEQKPKVIPSNKPPIFDVTSIVKDTPSKTTIKTLFSQYLEKNINLPLKGKSSSYSGSSSNKATDRKPKTKDDGCLSAGQTLRSSSESGQDILDIPKDKRIYNRDRLLSLKNSVASHSDISLLLRVDMKENCVFRIFDESIHCSDQNGRDYNNRNGPYYDGRSSQRGVLSKRSSQAGNRTGGSNSISLFGGSRHGGSNDSIDRPLAKLSISLSGDIKLNQAKNAWKPTRLNNKSNETESEDEKQAQILYKKVRSILNKLTPEKFDSLLEQFRALSINTSERLKNVIDIIFDKATDEPGFSQFYAKMCQEIHTSYSDENATIEEKIKGFRSVLVRRCQIEFEKSSIDQSKRDNKVKSIEECIDPDKKKELELELEEYDAKLRRKSLGTIRFIGELFKQKVLTANIVTKCMQKLLNDKDEESLECLCKLITTVGPVMDDINGKKKLELVIKQLQTIAAGSKTATTKNKNHNESETNTMKVGSRLRFMILDLIDLKNSNWIPRLKAQTPKGMNEIAQDVNNEQRLQFIENSTLNTNSENNNKSNNIYRTQSLRKELPPSRGSSNGSNYRQQRNSDNGGWNVVGNSSNKKQFQIQTDKIRVPILTTDPLLGPSGCFSSWGKGAGGCGSSNSANSNSFSKNGPPLPFNSNSSFSRGDNYDNSPTERQSHGWNRVKNGSKSRDYSSMGKNNSNYDRLSTQSPRSRSEYGNSHNYQQQNRFYPSSSTPGSLRKESINNAIYRKSLISTPSPPPPPFTTLIIDQQKTTVELKKLTIPEPLRLTEPMTTALDNSNFASITVNALIEVVQYSGKFSTFLENIKNDYLMPTSSSYVEHPQFIYKCLCLVTEKSQTTRLKFGEVLSIFLETDVITLENLSAGLKRFRNDINDIKIDVPQIWTFLGEIMADPIKEQTYPLAILQSYLTEQYQLGEESAVDNDYDDEILSPPTSRDIQLILKTIFSVIETKKSKDYMRELWQKSGLSLSQFGLTADEISSFVAENKLEYLVSTPTNTTVAQARSSNNHKVANLQNIEEIHKQLLEFLKRKTSTEKIISWISAHVGDQNTTNNQFLRVLASAIYEDSIYNDNKLMKLIPDKLIDNSKLIQKYVDYKVEYEIQCLNALQALSQRLEHPKGLLLDFCNTLYDNAILSKDAFIQWGESNDPTSVKGRGVALLQLNSFFTQLRENEDD